MRNLKTYEAYIPSEDKPDNKGWEVLGVFGPEDKAALLELINDMSMTMGTVYWYFASQQYHWDEYMKGDTALVVTRDGTGKKAIAVILDGDGHRMSFWNTHVPDPGRRDRYTLEATRTKAIRSMGAAGRLIYMGVLHELPEGMTTKEKVSIILDATAAGIDGKDRDVARAMARLAKRCMASGTTPTTLLADIRRIDPRLYKREFGEDDMAADMGDMGF